MTRSLLLSLDTPDHQIQSTLVFSGRRDALVKALTLSSLLQAVAFAWLAFARLAFALIVALGVVGGINLVLRKEGRLLSTKGKVVERG